MEENQYVQEILIDPYTLEEVSLRHPAYVMKYCRLAADAQENRDQMREKVNVCKADLERVKAELDRKIRQDPAKYIPHKDVKEASIGGAVLLQPEYEKAYGDLLQANRDLIKADYDLSILQGAVKAFEHQGRSIEYAIRLWERGYYSIPGLPHEIQGGKRMVDMARMARDDVSAKIREGLNKDRSKGEVGERIPSESEAKMMREKLEEKMGGKKETEEEKETQPRRRRG